MTEWIINLINSTGYFGVFLLVILDNIFPPIPSEFILPLCGYLASQNKFSLIFLIAIETFGSVLSVVPFYYLGIKFGEERLETFAVKYGKWLTISPKDIKKSDRWFKKHDKGAVLFCRLIPGLRSVISITAGVNKMKIVPFVIFTAIGAGIWNSILTVSGYLLGRNYSEIEKFFDPVLYILTLHGTKTKLKRYLKIDNGCVLS